MAHRIRVEFYKPAIQPSGSFQEILSRLAKLQVQDRIRKSADPMAIFELTSEPDAFVGGVARIRMQDLPQIMNAETFQIREFEIEDQEGLGEEMYFLYDSKLDVVAIQRKWMLRASALSRLISDLMKTSVNFDVILREDAWDRFNKMGLIKKIGFRLARPKDLSGAHNRAVIHVLAEIDEFKGVTAKLEVSVGRQKKIGLDRRTVQRFVKFFRGLGRRGSLGSCNDSAVVHRSCWSAATSRVRPVFKI